MNHKTSVMLDLINDYTTIALEGDGYHVKISTTDGTKHTGAWHTPTQHVIRLDPISGAGPIWIDLDHIVSIELVRI